MFKKLTFIIALLASCQAFAGSNTSKYDSLSIGDYDEDSGVYVQLVKSGSSDESGRGVNDSVSKSGSYVPNINMFIYNPKDDAGRYLLDKNYGEITDYLLETSYSDGSFSYFATKRKVLNNSSISKRAINPNVLIETYHTKTNTYTVWKANKLAGAAKALFSYQLPSQWHLDAKNQVIRLISPTISNQQPQLKVTNFVW
jgi:hypothetical protein